MSMDLDWGVSFSRNDTWSELACVGRVSSVEDAGGRWYLAILGSGRIELIDLDRPLATTVHRTEAAAVRAMKAAMSRQDSYYTPVRPALPGGRTGCRELPRAGLTQATVV